MSTKLLLSWWRRALLWLAARGVCTVYYGRPGWHAVSIGVHPGTEMTAYTDEEDRLVLMVRRQGEEWPDPEMKVDPKDIYPLEQPDHKYFKVTY